MLAQAPPPTLAEMTSTHAELQVATVGSAQETSSVESDVSAPAAPIPLPVQRSLREPEPVTGSSPSGPLDNLARIRPGTIRRSIESFDVDESETFRPPGSDLIKTLKDDAAGLFQEDDQAVSATIKEALVNTLVKPIETPRELTVEINDRIPTKHPVRGRQQTNVGQIGGDEFFIRTGLDEAFEGGHLVGHQFWDARTRTPTWLAISISCPCRER